MLHLKLDTAVAFCWGSTSRLSSSPLRFRSRHHAEDSSQAVADPEPRSDEARKATADAQARLSAVEAKLAGLDEEIKKLSAQVEQESAGRREAHQGVARRRKRPHRGRRRAGDWRGAAQAKRGLRNFAADLAIGQAAKQIEADAGDRPRPDRRVCGRRWPATARRQGRQELDGRLRCPLRPGLCRCGEGLKLDTAALDHQFDGFSGHLGRQRRAARRSS